MNIKFLSPIQTNKLRFAMDNVERYADGRQKILDVGCGEGGFLEIMDARWSVLGVDLDLDRLSLNDRPAICANVENLPLRSNSFDMAVCVDVLEHVRDDRRAMGEISRVLKKDGILVLSVPTIDYPWTYDPLNAFIGLFGFKLPIGVWGWGHQRLYKADQMKKLLVSNGFEIVRFERQSHGFVTLFVNYIPTVYIYVLTPLKKWLKGNKRTTNFSSSQVSRESLVYRVYNGLNLIDKRYFSWTNAVNICFVARKVGERR